MRFYQRGSVWYADYTDAAGRRRQVSTGAKDRTRAEIAARKIIRDSTRLIDYSAVFFTDECPHSRRLVADGRSYTVRHRDKSRRYLVNSIWADPISRMPIEQIRRSDVLDFRDRIWESHKPNTAGKILEVLKVILSEAEFREDIPRNPGARVGKVHYQVDQPLTLSKDQLVAYALAAPPALRFLALTGLRIGEMSALDHSSIDGRIVHIDRSVASWGTLESKAPKWEKKRYIYLPEEAPIPDGDGGVFKSPRGEQIGYSWIARNHRKTLATAGLPSVTRHALRASLHAVLATEGVHVLLLAAWFGWAPREASKVQDGYFRPTPDQLKTVADTIDRIVRDMV